MTIEDSRAADAKAKSAFFNGATDRHPHGLSGLRFVLPYENDKRNLDASIHLYSEWGHLAGMV